MASKMPHRDGQQNAGPQSRNDEPQVASRYACPQCGERRKRYLMWLSPERLRCLSCGGTYTVVGVPA